MNDLDSAIGSNEFGSLPQSMFIELHAIAGKKIEGRVGYYANESTIVYSS